MKRVARLLWALAAIVGLVTIAAAAWFFQQGIGARTPPGALESSMARAARRAMIPAHARRRVNQEPQTTANVRAGLEHWADHCATCHANDGSGNTEMGRGLYPPAPDMRQPATQQLTDGELFYIIENGVKLTGMPAWGTGSPDGEASSWQLVHFIRLLPSLGEAELAEMEDLNPRSPAAWRAREEERRFLSGEPPPAPAPAHKHD